MTTDKFHCPRCGNWKSRVIRSAPDAEGTRYLRWRECVRCHQVFETGEAVTGKVITAPATVPLVDANTT